MGHTELLALSHCFVFFHVVATRGDMVEGMQDNKICYTHRSMP